MSWACEDAHTHGVPPSSLDHHQRRDTLPLSTTIHPSRSTNPERGRGRGLREDGDVYLPPEGPKKYPRQLGWPLPSKDENRRKVRCLLRHSRASPHLQKEPPHPPSLPSIQPILLSTQCTKHPSPAALRLVGRINSRTEENKAACSVRSGMRRLTQTRIIFAMRGS